MAVGRLSLGLLADSADSRTVHPGSRPVDRAEHDLHHGTFFSLRTLPPGKRGRPFYVAAFISQGGDYRSTQDAGHP